MAGFRGDKSCGKKNFKNNHFSGGSLEVVVLYNNNTILALGINTQASYHKLIPFCIQSVDRLI